MCTTLASCNGGSSSEKASNNAGSTELEGTWRGVCERDDEYSDESSKSIFEFTGSNFSVWTEYYDDDACSTYSNVNKMSGTFEIGGAIESTQGLSGKELDITILNSGAGNVNQLEKSIYRIDGEIFYTGISADSSSERSSEFDMNVPFYKGESYTAPAAPSGNTSLSDACGLIGDATNGSFMFPKAVVSMSSYNYLGNNQAQFKTGFLAAGNDEEAWVCLNSGIPTQVNPSFPCPKDSGEVEGLNTLTIIHTPSLLYCTYSYNVDLSAEDVRTDGSVY